MFHNFQNVRVITLFTLVFSRMILEIVSFSTCLCSPVVRDSLRAQEIQESIPVQGLKYKKILPYKKRQCYKVMMKKSSEKKLS